jgi:predicted dinucleotide-binding enzyme
VKALNTGDSDVFVSGNDAEAKATVSRFLREQFGWKNVVDLGDITTARGTEAYLLLWVRPRGSLKTGDFNIKIVKK